MRHYCNSRHYSIFQLSWSTKEGQVDSGLGKTTSVGTVTLIPPTDLVKKTGETCTIDGVEMTFQMAPRTEAPAEFLIHFPQLRALCAAEDATHTLHNLYTLRGAQVRDAKSWWKSLNESVILFGGKTDVVFAQHQWPMWGQTKVLDYLRKQRDLYKYIHDQSLRLMNHGYTMLEIAEMGAKIGLPFRPLASSAPSTGSARPIKISRDPRPSPDLS